MGEDDDFEPKLGRMRARKAKGARAYLSRVIAAANLARGGARFAAGRGRGPGHRGRGSGIGRALARRDAHAAFRQRRVIVKARIVKLAGTGAAGAVAHLRYVQRDGVTREGAPGALYGAADDRCDGREFLARGAGDRHQFRFIVSAEDGDQFDDLRPLTRRLMQRVEDDLGTKLDWVAVDHFNTGRPHTHIIVRGKDDRGADLIIARDYLAGGLRERAAELISLDLGPRSDREIEVARRAEIARERLTSIDRAMLRDAGAAGVVEARGRSPFEQALRSARLATLKRMGLVTPLGGDRWQLDSDLAETLRRLGERGDIIRTMQRDLSAASIARAPSDWSLDPGRGTAADIVGRVVSRGLADEHTDRHYLVIDGIDGRAHYVAIGRGDAVPPLGRDAVVRIERRAAEVRQADKTIIDVAGANGGRYTIDAHLTHDASATEDFTAAHVRRLEAIRRTTGGVEREPDGAWVIAPDHLAHVEAFELKRLTDRPVEVTILSPLPLHQLVSADAATWLERGADDASLPVREAGFGAELIAARTQRAQWLIDQGLAERTDAGVRYPAGLAATLERRDLLRAAAGLSSDLALPFAEPAKRGSVEGIYRRRIDLASGRFAVIERSRDFTLVPWRPVLEQRLGQQVSGAIRPGGIAWTFGRARSGPAIE